MAIPAAACFILAAAFLYAALRRATGSRAAAVSAVAVFSLNPNLLYLQSTPMTEPIFFAAFAAGGGRQPAKHNVRSQKAEQAGKGAGRLLRGRDRRKLKPEHVPRFIEQQGAADGREGVGAW